VIFQSCLFAITAVLAKAVLGFTIAHLMHNLPPVNQRIWRGLLLVPWVIPLAISRLGGGGCSTLLFGLQLGLERGGPAGGGVLAKPTGRVSA